MLQQVRIARQIGDPGSGLFRPGLLSREVLPKRSERETGCLVIERLVDRGMDDEAIQAVRPYAVDVTSGVEAKPGKKDPAKLRAFFDEVARANRDISS